MITVSLRTVSNDQGFIYDSNLNQEIGGLSEEQVKHLDYIRVRMSQNKIVTHEISKPKRIPGKIHKSTSRLQDGTTTFYMPGNIGSSERSSIQL
jgi:hypothetical protein